jgi:hypothetical protein
LPPKPDIWRRHKRHLKSPTNERLQSLKSGD